MQSKAAHCHAKQVRIAKQSDAKKYTCSNARRCDSNQRVAKRLSLTPTQSKSNGRGKWHTDAQHCRAMKARQRKATQCSALLRSAEQRCTEQCKMQLGARQRSARKKLPSPPFHLLL
eukprot:2269979-Pyramimonas_sp.AAC.1